MHAYTHTHTHKHTHTSIHCAKADTYNMIHGTHSQKSSLHFTQKNIVTR